MDSRSKTNSAKTLLLGPRGFGRSPIFSTSPEDDGTSEEITTYEPTMSSLIQQYMRNVADDSAFISYITSYGALFALACQSSAGDKPWGIGLFVHLSGRYYRVGSQLGVPKDAVNASLPDIAKCNLTWQTMGISAMIVIADGMSAITDLAAQAANYHLENIFDESRWNDGGTGLTAGIGIPPIFNPTEGFGIIGWLLAGFGGREEARLMTPLEIGKRSMLMGRHDLQYEAMQTIVKQVSPQGNLEEVPISQLPAEDVTDLSGFQPIEGYKAVQWGNVFMNIPQLLDVEEKLSSEMWDQMPQLRGRVVILKESLARRAAYVGVNQMSGAVFGSVGGLNWVAAYVGYPLEGHVQYKIVDPLLPVEISMIKGYLSNSQAVGFNRLLRPNFYWWPDLSDDTKRMMMGLQPVVAASKPPSVIDVLLSNATPQEKLNQIVKYTPTSDPSRENYEEEQERSYEVGENWS